MHFPDQATPHEETLTALDALVTAGKVREIGCSNFTPEMIDESARDSADNGIARYVSVQNEYSLLRRGPEKQGVLDACVKHDLAFIPYFPLASGVLSGKYARGAAPAEGTRLAGLPADRQEQALSDAVMNRVEALDAWARDHGHTLLELAFSWLLARPAVASVIAGATKPEQVAANAAAAEWRLTAGRPHRDRRRHRRRQSGLTVTQHVRLSERRRKTPRPGNAFELLRAAVLEHDVASEEQAVHRLGHQHLAAPGEIADAARERDSDSRDVVTDVFDFARVNSDALLHTE